MHGDVDPLTLSPEQFERQVKAMLEAALGHLPFFDVEHRDKVPGSEGVYEIDVSVRFKLLEADFLVLVECKHQKNPVKREAIQVLHDRIRSTGAHKGIVFATTTFQRGAVEYALAHGIALVRLTQRSADWVARAAGSQDTASNGAHSDVISCTGWLIATDAQGTLRSMVVSVRHPQCLARFLSSQEAVGLDG